MSISLTASMTPSPLEAGEKAEEKRCYRCKALKPVEGFYRCRTAPDGRQYECKACTKQRHAGKAEQRRDTAWRHALRTKFGMSDLDYQALYEAQAGICAICGKTCKTGNRLVVDHDHATGRVRGLLCRNCNVGLGHFGDCPDRLKAALSYLNG